MFATPQSPMLSDLHDGLTLFEARDLMMLAPSLTVSPPCPPPPTHTLTIPCGVLSVPSRARERVQLISLAAHVAFWDPPCAALFSDHLWLLASFLRVTLLFSLCLVTLSMQLCGCPFIILLSPSAIDIHTHYIYDILVCFACGLSTCS